MTTLGEAIHVVVDYFFCDRCAVEATDDFVSRIVYHICLLRDLWKFLPGEPFNCNHKVRWPRSTLQTLTGVDFGKQTLGEDAYEKIRR